ncbi:unnamed protein product, partial [Brassica rapa subsp. trilocularis]
DVAGNKTNNLDDLYVGMIFKNREEFKQHMALTNELQDVNPPASRRPPGRPRKNRILSIGEYQTRGPRKRTLCGRCKRPGHNRATCKMPI